MKEITKKVAVAKNKTHSKETYDKTAWFSRFFTSGQETDWHCPKHTWGHVLSENYSIHITMDIVQTKNFTNLEAELIWI